MKTVKRLVSLLLALVMVFALTACGGKKNNSETKPAGSQKETQKQDETKPGETKPGETQGEEKPDYSARYGGYAVFRSASSVVASPDPTKNYALWRLMYLTCIYEPAVTRDSKNDLAPGVCDFELSEDMLTLTLKVREGKKFTNGDTVDINDVKASIDRACALYSNDKNYIAKYLGGETPEERVNNVILDEAAGTLTLKFTEYNERTLFYFANQKVYVPIMPKEICDKYGTELLDAAHLEDVIGTVGYVVTEWIEKQYVMLKRAENWEVFDSSEYDGYAGTKYCFLDQMKFVYNGDDGGAALAVLSGDYDMVEAIPSEYMDMAKAQGVKETILVSDVGTCTYFNCKGENNVCAKYPSLRKAFMAAMDYEEFLKIVTDNQQIMGGYPFFDFPTDIFEKADYYGPTNMEAVKKYTDAAKAEGWNGTDPIVMVRASGRTDIGELMTGFMKNAGIPFKLTYMESGALTDFTNDANNVFDVFFNWPTYVDSPVLQPSQFTTYWSSDERKAFTNEMTLLPKTDPRYQELGNAYNEFLVDQCGTAYMSMIGWYWYTPEDFMMDLDVDKQRNVFYNYYWGTPADHPYDNR